MYANEMMVELAVMQQNIGVKIISPKLRGGTLRPHVKGNVYDSLYFIASLAALQGSGMLCVAALHIVQKAGSAGYAACATRSVRSQSSM